MLRKIVKGVVSDKRCMTILSITIVCAVICFWLDWKGNSKIENLTRNSYGEGAKTMILEAKIDDKDSVLVETEVQEQKYNDEKLQDVFQEIVKELDFIVLGKNKTFEYVTSDLNLPSKVSNYPVSIDWVLDSYEVISPEGKLYVDEIPKEGCLVKIEGILRYEEEEAFYVKNVMIYPPANISIEEKVKRLVQEAEKENREEQTVLLPTEIEGEKICWQKKKEYRGFAILLLGGILISMIPLFDKQKEKEEKAKRKELLEREYPNLIESYILLLDTGVTPRAAWKKLVEKYETRIKKQGKKFVYEEMAETLKEMKSGITEAEAYERFGQRCGTVLYRKFGALLAQNAKKGAKGLAEILALESIQATATRKSRIRQKGEEIGSKLLIPMIAMLGVVLVIVMIPAFMSINI